MLRSAAAVALLAAALLAGGCGGDEKDPTQAWADGLCSGVTTWADDVRASVDPLRSGNLSQDSIEGAIDGVRSATETLESDLDGLGRPETDSGEEAQEAVSSLTDDLTASIDQIESAFAGASGASGLMAAASTAAATIRSLADELQATVTRLRGLDPGGELSDAFEQSDDCGQLQEELSQVTGS